MPWPQFEVDWRRAALLVIDMQNYGCNPDAGLGPMLSEGDTRRSRTTTCRVTDTVIPNAGVCSRASAPPTAASCSRTARSSPTAATWSRVAAAATAGRSRARAWALWHRGTFEHRWSPTLAPAPGELVLDKNTSSAFSSAGIEWLLRNMDVETLVLVGMATDMCVETTARDAADRGFNVIVVEDATATFFEHHHRER